MDLVTVDGAAGTRAVNRTVCAPVATVPNGMVRSPPLTAIWERATAVPSKVTDPASAGNNES